MTTNLTPSPLSSSFAPIYQSDLARTIGVLQQLQKLVVAHNDASLADVQHVVQDLQRDFGEDTQLESVIQALVGQHLALQMTARLTRQQHTEARKVLA